MPTTTPVDLSDSALWQNGFPDDLFAELRRERPIFHQLEHRVEAHIFLCVLAYHLLISIEKTLLDRAMAQQLRLDPPQKAQPARFRRQV